MKTHKLKIWNEPFEAVTQGTKNFEVRHADRDFQVGDVLILQEYDSKNDSYTGRSVQKTISYITRGGEWGLPLEVCVLGWRV